MEAKFCFAKGLNETERTEAKKSYKVKKLEARLINESNSLFYVANKIRNRELKKINDENLFRLNELYCEKITRINKLANGYFKLTENTHPNYEKLINYAFVVLDTIELEIAKRDKTKRNN